MNDDLKLCRVCGSRLASMWRGGELVYYCAYCVEAAEAEVARLQAQLKQAQDDGRLMLVSMGMKAVGSAGRDEPRGGAVGGEAMSVDLKPCPFCGGRADSPEGPDGVTFLPRCTDCYAGPEDAAWNRRPMEDALRARAEAAEAEVARVAAERDEARAAAGAAAAIAQAAQAGAARMRAEAAEARDDAELERGRVAALEMCVATSNNAVAEAHDEVARLRAELAQARAEGEAAGAARERAAVVGYLREQADEDHDPWLIHLADDVAAGQHWGAEAAMREAGEHGGAAGRGAR